MSDPILAAGTVCWRRVTEPDGGEQLMVLLIHRTKQKDVSFPKGKLDPGESMPQAAVRETLEETGLSVSLGVNLGTITYQLPNGDDRKTVQYWAAEVTEKAVEVSTFRPNNEVAALEWVPLEEAKKRLSYRADRELFDVFVSLARRGAIDTFSVVLLRHAKAEQRSIHWPEDRLRPLTDRGEQQAETLVPTLEAFGPVRILSSTAERCMRTVTPLAHHLHKTIRVNEGLSQEAWDEGRIDELRSIVGKVVRKGKNAVICTHRPVLPDAARELALATGSLPGAYLDEAAALPPGGFSVFHLSRTHPGRGILGVETYPLKH
ncbi:MAG: NUDIX domain-containing protein [Leucobacter sp.]